VREAIRRLRDLTSADAPTGEERRMGVEEIARHLRHAAGEGGDVELVIGTNRITFGDDAVYKSDARENNLAFELFRQGLRRVTFKSGVSDEEIDAFVRHFSMCREIEKVDEDFVSTLWRETLPGIQTVAIDGFTEKIFMADEAFTSVFRAVIDDLCPGLLDLPEDDEPDLPPRERATLDAGETVERGLGELRTLARTLPAATTGLRAGFEEETAGRGPLEHLLHLLAGLALKQPCALEPGEVGLAVLNVLESLYSLHGPEAFADAGRTLLQLTEPVAGQSPPLAARARAVREVLAGRPALAMVARHYDAARPEVTAWLRWYFVSAGVLTAPDLLGLINSVPPGHAHEFLKDLLRRQGTSSLEPWAERLRDDDPGVVLEVLEVILGSELGDQAQPLLLELLRHRVPEVRARAIDGFRGAYSQPLRQALLPLLRDPASAVRRSVLARFATAGDPTVATYVAATIKSPMFLEFDDDEQLQFFEGLSQLGGEKFIDVYRERLSLEEAQPSGLGKLLRRGGGVLYDTSVRRAALAGLGLLGTPAAIALIRECHAKADLELAAQCDVALRMSARAEGERRRPPPPTAPVPSAEDSAAVVAAGADKLGSRLVFEIAPFRVEPPARPRPAPVLSASGSAAAGPRGGGATTTPARPAAEATPGRAALPLSELPLLAPGEVFLAEDERRLRAEPGHVEDGQFTLTSPRVSLVGVEAARGPVVSAVPVAPPGRAAPRVVERAARAAGQADWTHQPDATLADILSSYLDDEAPAPAATVPPPPDPRRSSGPAPPSPTTRPATGPVPPTTRPATGPVPPTTRPATGPVPPTARPATGPVPPAAPASSATAPVAGAAGAATGIDDVLKEFLDLDLGD
jgi:hypothetical protein